MRDRKNFIALFLFLAIALPLGLKSFPLWLDAPTRSNVHDPKFSGSSGSSGGGGGGGGACGSHTAVLANFEGNTANDKTLWNCGRIFDSADALSTITPATWTATSGSAPLGSGNSSSFVARINGTLGAQLAPPYTDAYLAMELAANGAVHPATTTVDVNVSAYSPNKGVSFDYRVPNASAVTYRLELVQAGATATGFYQCSFTPVADGNWHTIVMYFPDAASVSAGAPNVFGLPGFATHFAWTPSIGALQFQVNPTASSQAYDLSIDNVTFTVPVYTAPVHTGKVTDFEPGASNANGLDTEWNNGQIYIGVDSNGSSISPSTWSAGSGTAPLGSNNSSATVARISGVLKAQLAPPYTDAYLGLELVAGGSTHPNGTNIDVDVASSSPNSGISFDYRVPNASTVTYRLELVQNGADTNGGYFQSSFDPAALGTNDGNWHTLSIYFPQTDAALHGAAIFALPGFATSFPWSTKIGALQFQVNPTGLDQNFDLSVDNITFNAPVYAPSPAWPAFVTPSAGDGHTIMDFEDPTTNWQTVAPYAGPAHTGAGTASLAAPTINAWDYPTTPLGFTPGSFSTSNYCGGIYGTMPYTTNSGGAVSNNPYAVFEMLTAAKACFSCDTPGPGPLGAAGTDYVDLSTLCTNKRLRFDFRAVNDANGDGRGLSYGMQWTTQDIPDYAFYEFDFTTPNDTNWHTAVVYWPSSPCSPKMKQAYCDSPSCGGSGSGPYNFNPQFTGEFLLRVIPQSTGTSATSFKFNIQIDNIIVD